MTKTLPRKVSELSPFKEIRCGLCGKVTTKWNRHHFKDGWVRSCTQCHDDINYYIAKYEQDLMEKKDKPYLMNLLEARRRHDR